jgi:hypothetical protein
MKAIKSLTLATLALAAAGTAYSQTTIRIVASNGDRSATQTAIANLLAPGWTFNGINGAATASNLSTATGANFGAWNGTYAGNPVIIKVSYSGALAGIAAIAGNTDQNFVLTNGADTATVPNPLTGAHETAKADFGFSTNFQSTSPFNGVYGGVTYSPVLEELVGVTPLGFFASPGFPTDNANITTQLAQQLYTSGSLSLQLFTGKTTDLNKTVWAIGRNTDAGQRFGALTEIGLGTGRVVTQWQPTITGQSTATGNIKYGGTAVSHVLWPAESPSGISSPLGSGGYSSGALLTEPLTSTLGPNAYKGAYTDEDGAQFLYPDATAGYYIGYVTPGDAASRITPFGGVALKYNGVDLTDDNVKNGKYTAWLYNRLLKPNDGRLTGLQLTFANALGAQIKNIDAPAGGGILLNQIKVKRTVDGGIVTILPPAP